MAKALTAVKALFDDLSTANDELTRLSDEIESLQDKCAPVSAKLISQRMQASIKVNKLTEEMKELLTFVKQRVT